jgi:hypothetical protein
MTQVDLRFSAKKIVAPEATVLGFSCCLKNSSLLNVMDLLSWNASKGGIDWHITAHMLTPLTKENLCFYILMI